VTLVTGSKFFEGPPFSGAVVLPPSMADEIENHILTCRGTVLKAVEYIYIYFSYWKTYNVSKLFFHFHFHFHYHSSFFFL
jgi:hypothetical protein